MGRLSPEEWRPILVSGLLYYKNLNRGMLKVILPIMAIALLSPLIILADIKLVDGSYSGILFDLIDIALIIILMLSIIPFMLLHKKLYLEMDVKAVQIVGRESLIASLTKLASIDQGMTTGKTGFFRPSIQERIQHLTNLPQ
jgi:fumarate reductase subunit C